MVWVEPALIRIGQTDVPGGTSQAVLYAAKNETESFQVAILGSYSGGTVTVTDLVGSGGILTQSHLTLYRENFVNIPTSSPDYGGGNHSPGPPGMYADGLIPFVDPGTGTPITSASLLAQPFNGVARASIRSSGVDVEVPAGTSAGTSTRGR